MADRVRIEGLDNVLKTLQSLPPEIVSKGGGPVRASLRKAAQVIQKQVQENLQQRIIDVPNKDGQFVSTGLTKSNIVLTRGRRNNFKGESMFVRVRNKKFKDRDGRGSTTAANARRLEYGTEKRVAVPFIRPAFEAKKAEALTVFVTEINKRIAAVVRKLDKDR